VARPTYNLHQRLNITDSEPTNGKLFCVNQQHASIHQPTQRVGRRQHNRYLGKLSIILRFSMYDSIKSLTTANTQQFTVFSEIRTKSCHTLILTTYLQYCDLKIKVSTSECTWVHFTEVLVSRPDQQGLGLGLESRVSRSWSWSRDQSMKVLVLVSRTECQGIGLGLKTRVPRSWSWEQTVKVLGLVSRAKCQGWSWDQSIKVLLLVSSFLKGLDNNTAYLGMKKCT